MKAKEGKATEEAKVLFESVSHPTLPKNTELMGIRWPRNSTVLSQQPKPH